MNASRLSIANVGFDQGENTQGYRPDQRRSTIYTPIAPATASGNGSKFEAPRNTRPPKRRRIACRDCRQAKLRCEGTEGGAQPCNRCEELSLECVVESDYKRVSKKSKLNELAEQVEQLRSAAQSSQNAQNTVVVDSAIRSPAVSTTSNHASGKLNLSPGFERQPSGSHPFPTNTARSIGHVSLNPEQISHLFRTYFEQYNPFFEILDLAIPPDIVYERSPLLFWTILVVATRQDQEDPALFAVLTPCIKKLLWSVIADPPHSLLSVQAMSLLCMWPFPTSSMSTDISFLLAGILRTAAVHIGLHKPELLQDYSRVKCQLGPSELREAVKVWTGCYIAAECVTASVGQMPYFPADRIIDAASQQDNLYDLPKELHHFLMIQRFCNKVHRAMGGNKQSLTGRPTDGEAAILMRVFEEDFNNLAGRIGSTDSIRTEILLALAHIQLHTYYLLDVSASDFRKKGLIKAYQSALDVLSKAESAEAEQNVIKHAPFIYMQLCCIAAILIMKVSNSSYSRFVDVRKGKRAFNTVISMSRRCCVEDNDLMGRMSKILAQLWNVHHSLAVEGEQEPGSKIQSRCCASILHDSLWLWRERFGGQPGNGAPPPTPAIMSTSNPTATSVISHVSVSSEFSPSVPVANFSPPSLNMERPLSQYGPVSHFGYATNTLETDYLPSTFDVTQEDQDWLWNTGFGSLTAVDLGFHSMSSGLGYTNQNQLQ